MLHVPLVFWKPGLVPAGRRVDEQVRTLDVAPTLLELAGAPPNPRHCARSLGRLIRGEPDPDQRTALSYSFYATTARAEGWKLIMWHGEAAETRLINGDQPTDKMQELYHVAEDPAERVELAAARPAELRRIRMLHGAALRTMRPVPPEGRPVAAAGRPAEVARAPVEPGVVHLRLSSDGRPHRLELRVRSRSPIALRALAGQTRTRAEPGGLVLEAEAAGAGARAEAAFEIDLAAAAEVEARLDGEALPPERLLAGGLGLALLSGPQLRLDRGTFGVLRTKTPPPAPEGLAVQLWGEAAAGGTTAPEVATEGPIVTPVHDREVTKNPQGVGLHSGA